MKLYLDTANRAAAEPLLATGLFSGVTTNPTILQRASMGVSDIPEIYRWAKSAGAREVFFQAWGADSAALVDCGLRLRELGEDVVVKVVADREGSSACANLSSQGVPTLLTAVYAPAQALVAAAVGATYIAPYLGKLQDAGRDGLQEVAAMQEALAATKSTTKILLASVRDLASMVSMARCGVSLFTVAPAVAEQLFRDELTAEAARTFERAVAAASI